jgi:hypothetical protein
MAALPRARTADVQRPSHTTKHQWAYNISIHRWQCSGTWSGTFRQTDDSSTFVLTFWGVKLFVESATTAKSLLLKPLRNPV